ncbi:MAG: prenyltransferase [Prevotella sp.]|nr:prenyltransferase [Candidatus Equicola stercoris]
MKKTIKDWIIATKPWSFNVSCSAVILTAAYLLHRHIEYGGQYHWWNIIIALVMIVCFHAAGNLLSDYRDFIYGIDKPGNDNEVPWISGGLFKPKEIRNFGYIMLIPAILLGILLLCLSSWEVIWIGILGIIFTAGYSWFKFHALGDVDILFCYAILPSLGTSFVVTGTYNFESVLVSFTYGLFTCGLLHYNNTRDIESDSAAGIVTMPILVGRNISKLIYFVFEIAPYIIVCILAASSILPWETLIVFITFPSALKLVRIMFSSTCAADLAGLDQANAKQQLMFSLALLAGIIIGIIVEIII